MPTTSGLVLTSSSYADILVGGAGDDTLFAGQGPDRLTGGPGADAFVFKAQPWNGGEITDFQPGVDHIDISALYLNGYHGSDPVADGYVRFETDYNGDTKVMLDADGPGGADPFFKLVAILDGIDPNGLTSALVFGQAAGVAGQTFQAHDGGATLQGSAGADTLIAAHGPDVLTGGGGADHFVFNELPWQGAQITDFTVGLDKIDVSALLQQAGYTGSDPVGDGYVKFIDDGHGDTWLYFDRTPSSDPWGDYVATLQHVAPASLGDGDLVLGAGTASPPPASPPPVSPPPAAAGQALQAQDGGASLVGGSGADTLVGAQGPDVMTGGAGADHFVFSELPWQGAQITDFTVGVDKFDVSALLHQAGYTGSDPVADGYLKFVDDGHGDTWVYFDASPATDAWGDYVATLQHVATSSLGTGDLIWR